ncbi:MULTISPECIES: low molecular weight phosphatase family protein [unclassified Mesorhizobium]|uniref:arsenate-mycothiol transferase ArsC n=1 Tax=unclassified Mesorhizobium TaxID=325217 RepID=UPI000FD3D08C|nr:MULTISPECIES: low molecular weight phosphatase family protein [unclassified Mesorhizobium]RUX04980.1 low molecular weight phosphatase family protein [Mesorhizobium sp. M8A.F.Ca.ET.023.01.1.1]RUX10030.1 low molecular weight phosphatase family protein [Mesorhizobium sp. M8A.F.Ca.ET.059.01.1.1]RVD62072.1 low molecular weight phosphatase family protein [Mesorhizobium sp. M8A.F.Ca.ET.023.02.2.1]TGU99577.1 low molecular weight phosphatase family protein [Mesorhizobium sp. M00.F.Ca.ET.151.01.1.1]T
MAGLTLAPGALPRSVLFLCGMNAVRSPMAEQLARRMLPPTIFVASAGVRAGERDPFVDAVLAEDGLTLGERHPRTLEDLEDDYFDLIVTLAPEAHHAALELTRSLAVEVEYWPTPDPTDAGGTREHIMASYRDVRERLKLRIGRRFLLPGAKNATD